jgi:hypothetical protein
MCAPTVTTARKILPLGSGAPEGCGCTNGLFNHQSINPEKVFSITFSPFTKFLIILPQK